MAQQKTSTRERKKNIMGEPRLYKVIMHNDDVTTMEFVVKVLIEVFFKAQPEAESLMLEVHTQGQAAVGAYTYDIAASKIRLAESMARKEGFPLKLTMQ